MTETTRKGNFYPKINGMNIAPTKRVLFPEPLAYLNKFFGSAKKPNGLLVGGSYLMTGEPNAGKTSLVLQMADALAGAGHEVIIDSTEMILSEINERRNDFGLRNNISIRSADSDDTQHDVMSLIQGKGKTLFTRDMELMTDIFRKNEELVFDAHPNDGSAFVDDENAKHVICFIDSIQSLHAGEGSLTDLTNRFVKVGQKCRAIIFFVGQVTKGGEAAGSNKIPHLVTGHIHMKVLDNESDNQTRYTHMVKNRAGTANSFSSKLSDTGHQFLCEGNIQTGEGGGSSGDEGEGEGSDDTDGDNDGDSQAENETAH